MNSKSDNIYQDLINQLDRQYKHNRKNSYATRKRYYEARKRFCRFLADAFYTRKIVNIAPKHIFAYVEYMKSKGIDSQTIKTDLSAIRFLHDHLPFRRNEELPKNDELELDKVMSKYVDRTWSKDEYNAMLDICIAQGRLDYAAMLCIGRNTGLRIHECLKIDTATANRALKVGEIHIIGKGGRPRDVPINDDVRMALSYMLAKTKRGQKLFVPESMSTETAKNRLMQFIDRHPRQVECKRGYAFNLIPQAAAFICDRYVSAIFI